MNSLAVSPSKYSIDLLVLSGCAYLKWSINIEGFIALLLNYLVYTFARHIFFSFLLFCCYFAYNIINIILLIFQTNQTIYKTVCIIDLSYAMI